MRLLRIWRLFVCHFHMPGISHFGARADSADSDTVRRSVCRAFAPRTRFESPQNFGPQVERRPSSIATSIVIDTVTADFRLQRKAPHSSASSWGRDRDSP